MSEKKRRLRFPILLKTAILIFIFSVVVVELAMTYYSLVISKRNTETYNNYANSLSSTIAKVIDVDDYNLMKGKVKSILSSIPQEEWAAFDDYDEEKIEHYMTHYEVLETDTEFQTAFEKTRNQLREIVESNKAFYVDCAYLSFVYPYVDADGKDQAYCCYVVDSAPEEDACPPGWLDPLYKVNRGVIGDPERGFPAYSTNTSYGYLISAGTFIAGSDRGYAFVDISMNAIRARQASSIVRLFVYLLITVVALSVVGLLVVYFLFSRPLKRISETSKSFNNKDPKVSHEAFKNLSVRTNDELSDLVESIKTMEEGVLQRINELVEVNQALISQEKQTAKMTALANRDSLTGVGSKTAYDYEAEKINERISSGEEEPFGIAMVDLNYLKNTNDEYGHVAGDEALIKLANIICLTFKHSPVYRVGGDEFVVILRNEDHEKIEHLISEFNERIADAINNEKLPQYERVSAAIGYAEFDSKTDKSIEDVFNRADQLMYKRKHEMKEEEKK